MSEEERRSSEMKKGEKRKKGECDEQIQGEGGELSNPRNKESEGGREEGSEEESEEGSEEESEEAKICKMDNCGLEVVRDNDYCSRCLECKEIDESLSFINENQYQLKDCRCSHVRRVGSLCESCCKAKQIRNKILCDNCGASRMLYGRLCRDCLWFSYPCMFCKSRIYDAFLDYCEDCSKKTKYCIYKNCMQKHLPNFCFCEQHTCKGENCLNMAYDKNHFCLSCLCEVSYCHNEKILGGKYCYNHTCQKEGCLNKYGCELHKCEYYYCEQLKHPGKRLCHTHTSCCVIGCDNMSYTHDTKILCCDHYINKMRKFAKCLKCDAYCDMKFLGGALNYELDMILVLKKVSKSCFGFANVMKKSICFLISVLKMYQIPKDIQKIIISKHILFNIQHYFTEKCYNCITRCSKDICGSNEWPFDMNCKTHMCTVDGCFKPKFGDDFMLCDDHLCRKGACLNACIEGSRFCNSHVCNISGCYDRRVSNLRGKNSLYCESHKCRIRECRKQSYKNTGYCNNHLCPLCRTKAVCNRHYCKECTCSKHFGRMRCDNPITFNSEYCTDHTLK